MLRHERRLLIDCLGIGVALTLFVVAADAGGLLGGLEDFLYDVRARTCQRYIARPTDTLVHLDIDDPAVETMGWPMPRAALATILDELRLAGPKVVEMDVLFAEPQGIQYIEKPDEPTTRAAATTQSTTHATTTTTTENGNKQQLQLPFPSQAGSSTAKKFRCSYFTFKRMSLSFIGCVLV